MSYSIQPNYEQYNKCDHLINNFKYLTVLESALIWCGIPKDEIPEHIEMCKPRSNSSGLLQNTFVHPYISCVEPRCRILHEAFDNGLLKMGRDGKDAGYIYGKKGLDKPSSSWGINGMGHIAHYRRTIFISDLKAFIQEYHPNDMPKTLFNDIEISKKQPISNDDYLAIKAKNDALQAENEKLNQRLEKAKTIYREQQARINTLQNSQFNPTGRTEQSYLATIGILLELLLTPKGFDKKAPFDSQAQIIQSMLDFGIYGQGKSTLENRFKQANEALEQVKKAKINPHQ